MKNRKKYLDRSNKNREYLISHFTPEYIESMVDKKEYVVGFGSENKSFCYLVEAGTKELGDIRGATSSKFGLWYGTHGSDKELKYRATAQHFGSDVDKAFEKLKKEIARIIRETLNLTEFKEIKSILSPMFKYKIMFLYNDKIMLPSFFFEDLKYFETCLGLSESASYVGAQKQLIKYRNEKNPELDNLNFMFYLYETFGRYSVKESKRINEQEDDKLNKNLDKEKDCNCDYITNKVDKVKLKKTKEGVPYYPRDPKMSLIALEKADYKCENDFNHQCFIRKSNNKPYTEVHHLIPISYHYKFNYSIDVPENIISLCSSCHNEIHYGKNANALIEKFYKERKQKLKEAGIEISLAELLKMYKN